MAGGPVFTLVCALLWLAAMGKTGCEQPFLTRFECIARAGRHLTRKRKKYLILKYLKSMSYQISTAKVFDPNGI
jgi:hypothetical protein